MHGLSLSSLSYFCLHCKLCMCYNYLKLHLVSLAIQENHLSNRLTGPWSI